MMTMFAPLWSDERGNSFVEMAFIAPVLATLLVGTVDISRGVSTKLQLEQAAQRAIERVQVYGYGAAGKTDVSSLQTDAATAAGITATSSNPTITAWLECNHDGTQHTYSSDASTTCGANPYARYVAITVQSSFTPLFGTKFFPGANADGTVTVEGYAVVRTQ